MNAALSTHSQDQRRVPEIAVRSPPLRAFGVGSPVYWSTLSPLPDPQSRDRGTTPGLQETRVVWQADLLIQRNQLPTFNH